MAGRTYHLTQFRYSAMESRSCWVCRWAICMLMIIGSGSSSPKDIEKQSASRPLARSEVIILHGAQFPEYIGVPKDKIGLFRSFEEQWEPVPFQIDAVRCRFENHGERCDYVLCGTGDKETLDCRSPLGLHDEIVFMSSDAGQCAADRATVPGRGPWFPFVEEIRIWDPASREEACVYLAVRSEQQRGEISSQQVIYRPDAEQLETPHYRIRFNKHNPFIIEECALATTHGWHPVVKGQEFTTEVSHLHGTVVYSIDTNDLTTELTGYTVGPVRVVRRFRIRIPYGPFLWSETEALGMYYRDRFEIKFASAIFLHQSFLSSKRLTIAFLLDPQASGMHVFRTRDPDVCIVDGRLSPLETSLDYRNPGSIQLKGDRGSITLSFCPLPSGKRVGGDERLSIDETGRLGSEFYYLEDDIRFASIGYSVPQLEKAPYARQYFIMTCRIAGPGETTFTRGLADVNGSPLVVSVGPLSWQAPKMTCSPWAATTQERATPSYVLRDHMGLAERKWGAVPIVTTGPDKGPGVGVKFRHPRLFQGLDSFETRLVYTLYRYQIAEIWYQSSRIPLPHTSVKAMFNYYHKPRARFYGIGNNVSREEGCDFSLNDLDIKLGVQHAVGHDLGFLVSLHARRGVIGKGDIKGLPDLTDIRPQPEGISGGWSNGLEFAVYRDTRDPPDDPLSGSKLMFSCAVYPKELGDFSFERYQLEFVKFVPLPFSAHRLALKSDIQLVRGRAPFWALSQIGGPYSARGYYEGRFRDRDRILLNAEYRFPVFKFLSGVLFLDCGRVYKDVLGSPSLKRLHLVPGLGMRFRLYPDLIARLDAGVSNEQVAVYLEFGHLF